MRTLTSCPVCTSKGLKFAFQAPTTGGQDERLWSASECKDCGHQFLNPQPSWDDLAPYYNESYAPYQADHGTESGDELLLREARRTGTIRHIPIPVGKRLLDAGSGAGSFLRLATKLGVTCEGIEPSEHAANIARSQSLKVFTGTIEEFAAQTSEQFDVITSHHVIEHVPAPVETLTAIKKLLAPGGYAWIAVPNAAFAPARAIKGRWHAADLPYHLMQFCPQSLRLAGERAGLKVRSVRSSSIPHLVEVSLAQYLRFKWLVPRRLTQGTGMLKPLANWYARRADAEAIGEAIIVEFEAP